MSVSEFREALRRQAPEFALELSAETVERFACHFERLVAWNRKVNLTRITEPEEAARRHFLESAYLATLVDMPARMVDVGSGAGFPGLPLACMWPDVPTLLVEPLVKRAVFLKEVAAALDLVRVVVRNGRFVGEDVDGGTLLVARALDGFDDLMPTLLESDARVVALFSEPDLLTRAARIAPERSAVTYVLPGTSRRFVGIFSR